MLVVFVPIFMVDTKLIYCNNFAAPLRPYINKKLRHFS